MFEKKKKTDQMTSKKKKSIRKKQGEKVIFKMTEDKNEMKATEKNSNFAFSQNIEIHFPNEKKIEIIQKTPFENPMYNGNNNNSFLEEDDQDFLANLPNFRRNIPEEIDNIPENDRNFMITTKQNSNQAEENKVKNNTNKTELHSIFPMFQTIQSKQETFAIESQNQKKVSLPSNDHSDVSDNDVKSTNRKYHQFSFYSKEPMVSNTLLKKLVHLDQSAAVNKQEAEKQNCLEIISEKDDILVFPRPCVSDHEFSITSPIEMLFPSVKSNKNLILKISKSIMSSESSQNEKIKYNSNIKINTNSLPKKYSNYTSDDTDLLNTFNININKKDKNSYLNKFKTVNSSASSMQKPNAILFNSEAKKFSIKDMDKYKLPEPNSNNAKQYESYEKFNSNKIYVNHSPVFLQGNQADDYHHYVVVHKQLKYGNKNLDLARKSQITDPKEILYNK